MISDASRYYGCFLHNVLEQFEGHVSVSRNSGDLPGFYLIEKLPFYVKYSTARVGPWTFNFQSSHQDGQRKMFEDHGECITAFVCGRDGIVAICYEDLRKILDTNFEAQEGVSIRRRHNQMYQVKGRNGVLERKISRNSLSELVSKRRNKAE